MLIGREIECARLAEALDSARAGAGGAHVLTGEPGIGKTTLLGWLREQVTDALILDARGVESDAELPYADLLDLLTPIVDRLDALPEAQAITLASALALGPPSPVDRYAVGVAVLGLLNAAAEAGPIVALLDDLQWLDAASRDALSFAVRRLGSLSVLLVGAQRTLPDEVAILPRAQTISVCPLEPADAARVLAQARGTIAPEIAVRLLAAARGNPLALVELLRLLTAAQLAGTDPVEDPLPTGNMLERAFAARLGPLSDSGRRAVVVAAADGSGRATVVLAALAALGSGEAALHEAEGRDLLTIEANAIEFRHPLVRSAAYHGADPAERRLVHGALANADDEPERRLWHRAAAAIGADEAIASELERAGQRALTRAAAGVAAASFERAAALTPNREERGSRLMKAATALEETGRVARSDALALEAQALIEDPLVLTRLVGFRAGLKMSAGEVESGHVMLVDEAARMADVDPPWAAAMLALAANLPLFRLQAPETLALAERAWALGDRARPRMFHERATLALAQTISGDVAGGPFLLELAREVSASQMGHRQSSAVGWPLVWIEEYGAARSLLTWAIGVQREGGNLRYLPQTLHALAELDFRVGRWVPALAEVYEAISLFEETGQPTERGFACATAARIEAALGREDACREHAREAFAADDASELLIASAYASAALGLLELGRGDADAAIAALAPVEGIVGDGEVGEPWLVQWVPDMIEACCRAGDVACASELLGRFDERAQATGRISALAAAARCRGMLAFDGDFDEAFGAAMALHQRAPTPFERARTELAWGERLRRAGRRTEARERLNGALQVFDRLGAAPWAERGRGELRASGQSVLTAAQRAEDMLTPQELQVAALIGAGATNREAAASLFLSAKTIEFHLGNVYRKLGIRSRTELARAVAAPA